LNHEEHEEREGEQGQSGVETAENRFAVYALSPFAVAKGTVKAPRESEAKAASNIF